MTQNTPVIASEVVQQLLQLKPIFQMCISKCWEDGKVKHIKCMSSQLRKNWQRHPSSYQLQFKAAAAYHLQTVDLYHGCICLSCITLHIISILLPSKVNLKPKGSRVSGEVTQLNLRSVLVFSWREKVVPFLWHVNYISCN